LRRALRINTVPRPTARIVVCVRLLGNRRRMMPGIARRLPPTETVEAWASKKEISSRKGTFLIGP